MLDPSQCCVNARLNYLADSVEHSLYRNGKVFIHRDPDGNDSPIQGATLKQKNVIINNARLLEQPMHRQLDVHGFELLHQPMAHSVQFFFDNQHVIQKYYPECTELVKQSTNATQVFAFDHNIRWPVGKESGKRIKGSGQQVQAPIHYVHGDYTLMSAPQRLRDLAKPPGINDTLRSILNEGQSLLNNDDVLRILCEGRRFAFINVWRNIDDLPVMNDPLALCDADSKVTNDLVVFEILYHDRIGENYFSKYSPNHKWWYYPLMTRDEVLLIKQWDSIGALAQSVFVHAEKSIDKAPCTFSFHTAFRNPNVSSDTPQRKSIEVRCVALFDY